MKKHTKHQLQRFAYTLLFLVGIISTAFLLVLFVIFVKDTVNKKAPEQSAAEAPATEAEIEIPDYSEAAAEDADWDEEAEPEEPEESGMSEEDAASEAEQELEEEAMQLLSEMTMQEKIYQLFVITPEALTDVDTVTAAGDATKEKLEQYPVGGLVYFAKNIVEPEQTKTMLSNVQDFSYEITGLPLFLCIDEEGGKVARIASNASFGVTNVGNMADVASADKAKVIGGIIGAYLAEYGFNLDFAPDADVLTDPDNQAIGERSFGADPQIVAQYAAAVSDGLHEHGIMSTFKHFPGHGGVTKDTHDGAVTTKKTYEELKEAELVPFAQAQEAGIDVVMAAHISVPEVVGDNTPASLSEKMITDILRRDLGYDGLIVTDALNMGAITQNCSSADASVKALQAGADLLLMPDDFQAAVDGVMTAVENGSLTENRINESVTRIIKAKIKLRQKDDKHNNASNMRKEGENPDSGSADTAGIKAMDVSSYQGTVDWKKVSASGIQAVMVRLGYRGYGSEGALVTDDRFLQNLSGARSAGLLAGVYFHSEAKDEAEAREEADYVIQQLNGTKLELPVAFDLEYYGKKEKRSNFLNTKQRTDCAVAFCRQIKAAGYEAMVYYDTTAASDKTIDVTGLSGIEIWAADYRGNEKADCPASYRMWQYSNKGSVDGISGAVDLDYLY